MRCLVPGTWCLIALTALAWLAAPAAACSPALFEPSRIPVQGPNCANRIDLNEIDSVHLGEAQSLGGGLAIQALSDGNGCYSRFNLVVHDCTAGQVMIIGTEHFALMADADRDPGERSGLEIIRDDALAARDAGQTRALADFASDSRIRGYGEPLVLRIDQSLQYDRHRLPLSCVCRQARAGRG